MSSVATSLITADELLKMGDIGRCELIYGELVMMSPAGFEHGAVVYRLTLQIGTFVDAHNLGQILGAETGFKIESNPDLVRAPDIGFVRRDRLTKSFPKGYFEGVPDLAVEVISPGDKKREVAENVNTWLAHGTSSCWVADPKSMTITIHRTGQKAVRLTAADQFGDEPALPGFVLDVSKIFKRP